MTLSVGFQFSSNEPVLPIGELLERGRDTAFEYYPSFISSGISPSPFRLPVKSGLQVYDLSGGMETFGMFDDSLPDDWGRRIIDGKFRKERGRYPTVLERLAMVGSRGKVALVYKPSIEDDLPRENFDFDVIAANAMDFEEGLASEVLSSVRRAGGSSGGARPKINIAFNPETGEVRPDEKDSLTCGFQPWIVKFNTRRDGDSFGELEYRYYQMACAAGVEMMPSQLIKTHVGVFFRHQTIRPHQ